MDPHRSFSLVEIRLLPPFGRGRKMPASVSIERLGRKLRVGFVGGGLDSVIGQAHFVALRTDGMAEVVAGAFSINPAVSQQTGRSLLVDEDRIYESWTHMLTAESERKDRIDAVVVITPPALHGVISSAFLEAGFHVLCEKPMTADADQAAQLHRQRTRVRRRALLHRIPHGARSSRTRRIGIDRCPSHHRGRARSGRTGHGPGTGGSRNPALAIPRIIDG